MRTHELLKRSGKAEFAVWKTQNIGETARAAGVAVYVSVARHGRRVTLRACCAAVRTLEVLSRARLTFLTLGEARNVCVGARSAFDDVCALIVGGVASR